MSNGFGGKKSKNFIPKKKSQSSSSFWDYKDDSYWYNKGRYLRDSSKYAEEINDWNNKGLCLYKLEKHKEALTAYENALNINPSVSCVWANKARCLYKLGDYEQSISSYTIAIRLSLNSDDKYEYWIGIGVSYTDLGDYRNSIDAYDCAIKIKPSCYSAWFKKSTSLYKLGEYEESLKCCDEVIKLKSNNYRAWCNKGISLAKLGRDIEALRAYNRAIEIKSDYPDALYNRGVHCYSFGHYKEALKAFDKVIELKPDYVYQAWHGKGSTLENLSHYEESVEAYNNAIKIYPNHQSWNGKGIALAELGKYEDSIKAYDNSLSINPSNWMAWINRGTAALRQNEPQIDNCLLPLSMLNLNLNKRGYQGQLACIEEGLKYITQGNDPEGWGQLHRAIGNTHYFYGRQQHNPFPFWIESMTSYETALTTLTTNPQFAVSYIDTLQDFIRVLLGLAETQKAEELLEKGINFLDSKFSPETIGLRERFEQHFRSRFHELNIDLCVQKGNLQQALEVAEMHKNTFLRDLLLGISKNRRK